MAGGAVLRAAGQLKVKMAAIAANMLQVGRETVELSDGMFCAGPAQLPFTVVANAAYLHGFLVPAGMELGLTAIVSYDPGNTSYFPDEKGHMNVAATYANAAGAVVLEVDPHSGAVAISDAAIVHDCGRLINPLIVDGQIQGAFAQAIGAVLLEELSYGADGQPRSTTLLDYLIPAFGSVPAVRILHRETPSALEGGFAERARRGSSSCPPPSSTRFTTHCALSGSACFRPTSGRRTSGAC